MGSCPKPGCNYTSNRANNLSRHMRTHNGAPSPLRMPPSQWPHPAQPRTTSGRRGQAVPLRGAGLRVCVERLGGAPPAPANPHRRQTRQVRLARVRLLVRHAPHPTLRALPRAAAAAGHHDADGWWRAGAATSPTWRGTSSRTPASAPSPATCATTLPRNTAPCATTVSSRMKPMHNTNSTTTERLLTHCRAGAQFSGGTSASETSPARCPAAPTPPSTSATCARTPRNARKRRATQSARQSEAWMGGPWRCARRRRCRSRTA